MVKVSIIVPIYNAGEYIERCAPSLTGQSLSPDEFEVLYIDDGSTDDSPERLERLAEQHSNVRVHHQENSGWPGKPRNVGVRMARGEYVHFVDQDDELAPQTLERLYRIAERNGSDIAFGKTYGAMQGPTDIFRRNRERCTVEDAPLFETLTPHKMFRRQFLLDHGIVFPEGRVRLEDQLFLARAYPLAKNVSILGDYPTYHWRRREDGGNNSSRPPRPEDYYGHLRNVVRELKSNTEPGELQDRLLRRSYRVEVLRPVTEPRVLQRTGDDLRRYYDIVRKLVMEEFPSGVSRGFPAIAALRGHLLETDRLDSLVELAKRTKGIRLHAEISEPVWRRGKLTVSVKAWLVRQGGAPVAMVKRDGRLLLDPELIDGVPGVDEWEVKDPFSYVHGEVLVQNPQTHAWWYSDTDLAASLEPLGEDRVHLVLSGETGIDPLTVAGGVPLEAGKYQVFLDVQILGIGKRPRLVLAAKGKPKGKAKAKVQRNPSRAAVGRPLRVVTPSWTGPGGQLELDVATPGRITLRRRVLLRASADERYRAGASAMVRRLPDGMRLRVRKAVSRTTR